MPCRIAFAIIDILFLILPLVEHRLLFTDCGALNAPADGSVNYCNGTTYLSVATFECRIGYTLEGDAMRICQANETWSNKNPTCQIKGENSQSMRNTIMQLPKVRTLCHLPYVTIEADVNDERENDTYRFIGP